MYDIEAIKRRIAGLEGKNVSQVNVWKPKVGDYKIRALPWKGGDPGMPFIERHMYYIGSNRGFLAPFQFNQPDPVKELCNVLWSSKSDSDKELAKKLRPSMRGYAPVIVRGEEDQGVRLWSFSKVVYAKLLSYWTDEEVGDILDLEKGYDIKVKITQPAGKAYPTTEVDAFRKSTPAGSPADIAKWMENLPNVDSMLEKKSTDDIKKLLDAWLSDPSDNSGVQKGGGKAVTHDEEKKSKPLPAAAKSKIDDAFADLIDE